MSKCLNIPDSGQNHFVVIVCKEHYLNSHSIWLRNTEPFSNNVYLFFSVISLDEASMGKRLL